MAQPGFQPRQEDEMIETLPFGKTGHKSTRLLFGAAAFFTASQEEADRTMETIIENRINHIDTAASYGDAEIRLGPWIENHRRDFFLATKTGQRKYQDAWDEIQRSLERLRTSQVDLIQLHAVIEEEEWEAALGPGGALEAALEAQRQGMVRFIGITSHTLSAPSIHLKSLERFDFDSVMLPWNYMLSQNAEYASQMKALVQICNEKKTAVQLIKTLQRRPWEERPRTHATWYEPVAEQHALDQALHWAMGHPGVFINTPGDMELLPRVLESAHRFEYSPSEEEMQTLMQENALLSLW
jgi:aryl-alcohol dehydrogenase-like predicted oxidoreductase